jgi:hypothetical protein
MIINCIKCNRPIKTGDEIKYTAVSFYKELGSKVAYSVSTPHEADQETFRHIQCPTEG